MSTAIRFYLDYVDPLLPVAEALARHLEASGAKVLRLPFELRPPPDPLLDPQNRGLEERRDRARALCPDLELTIPPFVPWTRKAHELARHAHEKGGFDRVHSTLAEAHLSRALDIGRIDVLVALARDAGLDASETKAVLDVDRFHAEIEELRDEALKIGVRTAPTFVVGGACLEGLPDPERILEMSRDARCSEGGTEERTEP